MIARKSGLVVLALIVAAPCLGVAGAHAQSSPVPYWTTAWPAGFGSGFTAGQSSTTYTSLTSFSSLAALDGSSTGGGNFSSRFDLPEGWFLGSESGGTGLTGYGGAWSSMSALSYSGTQIGYNFANASVPTSIYAGFGTLKYNDNFVTPLPGFDSTSSNSAQGYSVQAGVEFRPTSNLSLSVGASFTQQPQYDSGINSLVAPVASPFAFGARR